MNNNTSILALSELAVTHSQAHSSGKENLAPQPNAHSSILNTIGNTPVVRINKLAPQGINLFVKIEAFNPLGSVKDRVALGIIEAAEKDGSLKPGQTVIEATSGNTGIGLAMVCAQKGYPLVVVMAENFSIERRRLMRYLGAKVIVTPATRMGSGMLAKAEDLAEKHGWFLCRQFVNQANADVHTDTTANEILNDFPAGILNYFVSGYGTGGTLKGVARALRKNSYATKIIAAEPDNSPMLSSGVAQPYKANGDADGSHIAFNPHPVQGWSPDFLSKLTQDAVTDELIDDIVPVSGTESLVLARLLARHEGIFCGISGGATFAAALKVARHANAGSNILCMLPDTGERYLSTSLFDDIDSDMSEEEAALAATTDGYQFSRATDSQTKKQSAVPTKESKPSNQCANDSYSLIKAITEHAEAPIVIFSLEWCEFCWSVETLFKKMEVDYRAIHIDSKEYHQYGSAKNIQDALTKCASSSTIPQIYIAGEHFGGCTKTFKAFQSGGLQSRLLDKAISFKSNLVLDPQTLLPAWTHPR